MSALLSAVSGAQSRNSSLRGEELRDCALSVAALAHRRELGLLAADAAGERILGAALGLDDSLTVIDATHRLDGATVLLVSGRVAGQVGLVQKALILRSLGAARIEVAVLDGLAEPVRGFDSITAMGEAMQREAHIAASNPSTDRRITAAA